MVQGRSFRRDRHPGRGQIWIGVVAEIDLLARNRPDVPQQILQVAGDHRLAQGVADFAALNVERVLGDTAEFEVAVRVAAGKPRQDDAALGAGDDLVETAIAGRHDEIRYPGGLRQAELARDVEIHEEGFEPAVLEDVDIGGRAFNPSKSAPSGKSAASGRFSRLNSGLAIGSPALSRYGEVPASSS